MIARISIPGTLARAAVFPDEKTGKHDLLISKPTFEILAEDDNQRRITDIPFRVKMGPELYDLLKRILPARAAALNEDLRFSGHVPEPVRTDKDQYAYYGFGKNPLTKLENEGIGLIGLGSTEFPSASRFGKSMSGRPNFIYSQKLEPKPAKSSTTKSVILSNILNDSFDFNPLLAPRYEYNDPDYPGKHDKPMPTDHWIPVYNNGKPVFRPDGTQVFKPVPLTQHLPIYNFNDPKWPSHYAEYFTGNNPFINDSLDAWRQWGDAPTYATYTGMLARGIKTNPVTGVVEPGDTKSFNYANRNLLFAKKPGYFTHVPGLHEIAEDEIKNIKREIARKRDRDFVNKNVQEYAAEHAAKKQLKGILLQSKSYLRPSDTKTSGLYDQTQYYKNLIFRSMMKNDPDIRDRIHAIPALRKTIGDDIDNLALMKDVQKFYIKHGDYSNYNMKEDPVDKMIAILTDYNNYKRTSK